MTTQLDLLKRDWVEEGKAIFWAWAIPGLEFTSAILHDILPAPPKGKENWFGLLMSQVRKDPRIEKLRYEPSTRPQANGRVVAVWRVRG